MSETVFVAGATGSVGRHVLDLLVERGYSVRALIRSDSAALPTGVTGHMGDLRQELPADALRSVDCVVSCAGAPITPGEKRDAHSYDEIDWEGNNRLLEAAETAGVERFVYISLANPSLFMNTEYARAHEKMTGALRQSRLLESIIRPTAFFSSFNHLVERAKKNGSVAILGDGSARTNPIADEDVAAAAVDALRDQPREELIGGPEILTRERIAEMACEAAGVEPRIRHVPLWLARTVAALRRPYQRRIAESLRFNAMVSEIDWLAPEVGERRLEDHFAELASS